SLAAGVGPQDSSAMLFSSPVVLFHLTASAGKFLAKGRHFTCPRNPPIAGNAAESSAPGKIWKELIQKEEHRIKQPSSGDVLQLPSQAIFQGFLESAYRQELQNLLASNTL